MRTEAQNLEANANTMASNSSAELEAALVQATESFAQVDKAIAQQANIQSAADETTRVAQESAKALNH